MSKHQSAPPMPGHLSVQWHPNIASWSGPATMTSATLRHVARSSCSDSCAQSIASTYTTALATTTVAAIESSTLPVRITAISSTRKQSGSV